MKNYTVSGTFTRDVVKSLKAGGPREAARAFYVDTKAVPDHVEIDGEFYDVVGMCEGCQLGVLLDDDYGTDLDGSCLMCAGCMR